jgi:acetate---CoA ligase (ADP-forming) subunit alpha
MNSEERQDLDRMLHPRGVAVFGAVQEPGKFGHMIIQSLTSYGYEGRIYPVCPREGESEVFGLRVFKDLEEVEGRVDLACVCVPAPEVPGVLRGCVRKGVAGAEILSSGFAETGTSEGIRFQKEIMDCARLGLRILGPNCFGAHCPRGGITLLPGFDFSHEPGPVALISQSGGVAVDFGHEARMAGLGLSKVFSFGNGCDLDAVALLDYLSEDGDTGYLGLYLEGIEDGRGFLQILRNLTPVKPVVLWKGGLTPAGRRTAESHTGSMGGSARIWKGMLAQAGAVAVEGLDELTDTMTALVHLRRPGPRIALVGGGGAIGVFSSDLAHGWGLEMPPFGKDTRDRLRKWFPTPGNSMANPLDTGSPAIPVETMIAVTTEILAKESVDVLVVVLLVHPLGVVRPHFSSMDGLPFPGLETYMQDLLQALVRLRESRGKDFVVVLDNRANLPEDISLEATCRAFGVQYHAFGIPVYSSVKRALRAIRNASSCAARLF